MLEKELIFFDTEFSNLNPYKGEILSLALIKESGEELYLELEHDPNLELSDWVKENLIKNLKDKKISRNEAKTKIKKFVGNNKPIIVSFVTQYDTIYLYKLFKGPETPFHWMPVDFSSILFNKGYEPEEYLDLQNGKMFKDLGINTSIYNQHNALDDARLLRTAYLKLMKK